MGETSPEMDDLYRFLHEDPALAGRLKRPVTVPPPGHLGVGSEVLIAVVSSGGVAAILSQALVQWVKNRRSVVTVTIETPAGERISINAENVPGAEQLVREAMTRSLSIRSSDGEDG
ncbi:hypothetical protein ACIBQ2_17740 [Micromonospora sediminimaris]|uniref:effector-associated constant component EACC1 n=1 Tax=Micromonospora sediminimaris TaxID=547162 RepID=UPI0037B44E41